jgi:hypothetical protein
VTDPYLLSASDDAPVPTASADRIDELAHRMHVSRTMLEDMPPETLDRMEQSAAHREAHDLDDLLIPRLARRVLGAISARAACRAVYLEHGVATQPWPRG